MQDRNQISHIIEFIQKATKLGKYNSNTGNGILNAVKTAEKGLHEDEPSEISYLNDHIEELFLRQKSLNLSPQSQEVYFGRIRKAISDYKTYGQDAKAIYSWQPKVRVKKPSSKKNDKQTEEEISDRPPAINANTQLNPNSEVVKEVGGIKVNVLAWRLRPGVVVKIELPEDLTQQDVKKLKALLDIELGLDL
ncbi:unnamed protein product [Adineta steineri]|uniref:Uncharacterized protein n=1 Tax=Adineta steineri TaxID=433720 RepID=A0A815N992_9BILA|nr:unnamed protein product [Adineta steineri]CAF4006503.1 unnamed protein product [Adineta steineri]